jgi:hypothetical protein
MFRNEKVIDLSNLLGYVEDDRGTLNWGPLNDMEQALNSGADKDYSPETWEQQFNLLSAAGLVAKMQEYGVDPEDVEAIKQKLARFENPWVAVSL